MGAIKLGDAVTTPDNGVSRVRGVYPQGVQQVYKLTFADGRTARASGDHLWKVRVKHAWRIMTTDEMREILSRDTRASTSLAIPLADALTVHPYVLGALLGDVISIEPDGEEECSCIAVDHPDRLYVTDNFVVTHNTTVLNDFVHYLMAGCDVFAQGNSSEAGIRQTLKADALPVLFDESEQNNDREQSRVQGILALIRQSSTESQAKTLKGTAGGDSMAFHIRSMFCLASIQVGMQHQADIERLTVLAIKPKRDDASPDKTWAHISAGLRALASDEGLPSRLLRRSLDLLPVTLQNIKVFSEAATRAFGSVRDGDQYGAMLAGAWSLTSDRLATVGEADDLIAQYDWSEHRDGSDADESEMALGALMGAMVRLQGGIEVNVHELVLAAIGRSTTIDLGEDKADAILQRHGMRVMRIGRERRLVVSNLSGEVKKLVHGTSFEADLRGLLLRVRGAERHATTRFAGVPSRGISIPMSAVVEDVVDLASGAF